MNDSDGVASNALTVRLTPAGGHRHSPERNHVPERPVERHARHVSDELPTGAARRLEPVFFRAIP
jgi:hypothetical protein